MLNQNRRKILSNQWVNRIHNENYAWQTNCWGSTISFHCPNIVPRWIESDDMDQWLEQNTKKVNGPLKHGDILVMRQENGILEHTAIWVDKNELWHKPGSQKSRFNTVTDVKNEYR